jgi:hypothetical protein
MLGTWKTASPAFAAQTFMAVSKPRRSRAIWRVRSGGLPISVVNCSGLVGPPFLLEQTAQLNGEVACPTVCGMAHVRTSDDGMGKPPDGYRAATTRERFQER